MSEREKAIHSNLAGSRMYVEGAEINVVIKQVAPCVCSPTLTAHITHES